MEGYVRSRDFGDVVRLLITAKNQDSGTAYDDPKSQGSPEETVRSRDRSSVVVVVQDDTSNDVVKSDNEGTERGNLRRVQEDCPEKLQRDD